NPVYDPSREGYHPDAPSVHVRNVKPAVVRAQRQSYQEVKLGLFSRSTVTRVALHPGARHGGDDSRLQIDRPCSRVSGIRKVKNAVSDYGVMRETKRTLKGRATVTPSPIHNLRNGIVAFLFKHQV